MNQVSYEDFIKESDEYLARSIQEIALVLTKLHEDKIKESEEDLASLKESGEDLASLKESGEDLASLIELYYLFSLIEKPSEHQSNQLFAILDLALYDEQLAEAIEKVDLQIAKELEIRDKLSFYEELQQLQSLAPSLELSVETAFIPHEERVSTDDP